MAQAEIEKIAGKLRREAKASLLAAGYSDAYWHCFDCEKECKVRAVFNRAEDFRGFCKEPGIAKVVHWTFKGVVKNGAV